MKVRLFNIFAASAVGAIAVPLGAWAGVGAAVVGMLAASLVGGPVLYLGDGFALQFTVALATVGALWGAVIGACVPTK